MFEKRCKKGCYFPYDFNKNEELPAEWHNTFDMAVIDPPFIMREVWEKYTEASKILLTKDDEGNMTGRLLCTTVVENAPFMAELLGVRPIAFRPSIPQLVYQYNMYTNIDDPEQDKVNEEFAGLEVPSAVPEPEKKEEAAVPDAEKKEPVTVDEK